MKAYRAGKRPDPLDVFERVVRVVDQYIDFDRSLADQRTMGEMVACYILATWLLDAFEVVGFLWPSGERGSGKTQLLLVVTELAYLGELITAGGSFASLRDLADYGACLGFDDAESLSDPRTTNPDKRALLLAGNRRGVTIPLKEPSPDNSKKWVTRYVNVFCPRLFSAIRLPDMVLASRTIIVPLIRTLDRGRSNIDPLAYDTWPVERKVLLDDLWALGLAALPELTRWDRWVAEHAGLEGRNLQPWRAVLAVAKWLDECGGGRLYEKMDTLSVHYHQVERKELEVPDLTVLVVRALVETARINLGINDMNDVNDMNIPAGRMIEFSTQALTETAVRIVKENELEYDPEKITSRRVGRILGKLRLKQMEERPNKRGWRIPPWEVNRWALTYGLGGMWEADPEVPSDLVKTVQAEVAKALRENLLDTETEAQPVENLVNTSEEAPWWKSGIL